MKIIIIIIIYIYIYIHIYIYTYINIHIFYLFFCLLLFKKKIMLFFFFPEEEECTWARARPLPVGRVVNRSEVGGRRPAGGGQPREYQPDGRGVVWRVRPRTGGRVPRSDPSELCVEGRKEMFYLTTHSTQFILRLYGVGHMVKDHSDSERERGMFYLTTHSTHFIYGYTASCIW